MAGVRRRYYRFRMATVYHALGAKISVVEMMPQLIPGADADVVQPLHKRIAKRYANIMLKTRVTKVDAKKDGLWVTFEGESAPKTNPQRFDRILVAVGRKPNGKLIGADKAGVNVDDKGFIAVDKQMRTNVPHIYAIGDIVGNPMLAHKASAEGRVAAEVIAGKKHFFDPKCIPSVAYTDPEIAWVGVTETQAKEQGIAYKTGVFPWMASGRALSLNRSEGFTKLIFNEKGRVIGAGIAGVNAGDLISEVALAIEMGCDAEDIALTIHPHPTLSESVMMAAEIFEGTITDLYLPKKKDE
jgi:dihydrolipoamide dehydrogenase